VWSGEKFYSDDDEKDECFRKYSDPEESFHDHSEFLKTRSRYAKLFELKNTDYKGWAHGLKEAGYATNPKYPQLLIGIIERYDLGRFDYMSESDIAQFKQPKKHPSKTNKDDVREIVIKDKRSILYNNRTPYIIAKRGDTPEKIAKEFEMMTWQIVRYNDLTKDTKLKEGERIYIKPKRNRAEKDYHIVKKGETMRTISQDYGVKMKKIYKKNNMQIGDMVKDGEKLNLRKRKR
jgi:LysM repeat protein